MEEIKIGNQIWMLRNLDVDQFRNGEQITHAKTQKEWIDAAQNFHPAWCYYGNEKSNESTYGKLYNWYAVNDPRCIAPIGWNIPSNDDWLRLINELGGEKLAGDGLKSITGWQEGGKGNNSSGFTGLPGGYRDSRGNFNNIEQSALWWSSTVFNEGRAWHLQLHYKDTNVDFDYNFKPGGFSIRCIKN